MATELCCNILTGMILLLLLQANGQSGCDDCKTSFGNKVKIRKLTNVIMCRAVDEYVACFLHFCTEKDTLPLVQIQWLKGQIENRKFNCTIPLSLKASTTTSDVTNPTNISLRSNDRTMSTASVSTEFIVTSVMKNSQSEAILLIGELTDKPSVKTGHGYITPRVFKSERINCACMQSVRKVFMGCEQNCSVNATDVLETLEKDTNYACGALLLTVTGEVCDQMYQCSNTYIASAYQVKTRDGFCRITDTYLQCVKTTCHLSRIPDSVMDEIRQNLRSHGYDCDLSGSGSMLKSSLYLIPTAVCIIVSSLYL